MNKFGLVSLRYSIIIFLIFSYFVSSAQENNYQNHYDETSDFSSVSPVLSNMNKVEGWSMQENGSWIYDINRIPNAYEHKSRPETPKEELGVSNIIDLELRRVMVDEDQYVALIHKYHDGDFEFPILEEGWRGYKSFEYYIFRGEKLNEILPDDFEYNNSWGVDLDCYAKGIYKGYDEDDGIVEDEIKKAVLAVQKGEVTNNYNLVWGIHSMKDGDTEAFRFQIVKTFRKEFLVNYYTNAETWELNITRTFWQVRSNVFKSFIRDAQEYLVDIEDGLIPITYDSSFNNYYNWGVVRYQMGDYNNAIKYFKKALEVNPETDDFMLYSFRGNAYSKSEMYDDAIGDFDKALSLQPKDIMDYSNWVRNYFNRGVSKFYLDDMQGACKDWNKALELGFGQAHDYVMEYCE